MELHFNPYDWDITFTPYFVKGYSYPITSPFLPILWGHLRLFLFLSILALTPINTFYVTPISDDSRSRHPPPFDPAWDTLLPGTFCFLRVYFSTLSWDMPPQLPGLMTCLSGVPTPPLSARPIGVL